jgi:general secretion pathway protein G
MQALLQFSVIVAVSGILWMLLLDSLHAIQEQSERTVMESTVRNMSSGLQFEIAARIMRGEEASLPQLVGNNPMNYLENVPNEYIGACIGELLPDTWCFDAGSREIVYLPRQHKKLTFPSGDHRELRWRIVSAAELSGTKLPACSPVGAITLVSTTSFKWQ